MNCSAGKPDDLGSDAEKVAGSSYLGVQVVLRALEVQPSNEGQREIVVRDGGSRGREAH